MKVSYRGHDIDVRRERCMAGYSMLYYSIFRQGDQYECTSGHTEDASTVREFIGHMKARVDNELADADPWGEKGQAADLVACGVIRSSVAAQAATVAGAC